MKIKTLSVLTLALMGSTTLFAQKKVGKLKKDKNTVETISEIPLNNETDSLSYAFGAYLSEGGLEYYLTQQGILTDKESIENEYKQKIEAATSSSEKEKLSKELDLKIEEIDAQNKKSIENLLQGIKEKLTSEKTEDKAYSQGLVLGDQILSMSEKFSSEAFNDGQKSINKLALLNGLKNHLEKDDLRINNSKEVIENKMKEISEKAQAEEKKKHQETIDQGEKFMAENAQKTGVITLEDGLQYKIIEEGSGSIPTATDNVKVHYKGSLLDGTVFDSSYDRGQPLDLNVAQVIPGWTEVLQMMPVGSKWEVYIPYNLGYGERGGGGKIPPYANLIFEIELIDIVK